MSFIIAIDGPAGSGKGTVAKLVGEQLGFMNIDTGATYRCIALEVLNRNLKLEQEKEIVDILKDISITFKKENEEEKVFLNGKDVTKLIREEAVNNIVSQVSHIQEVRNNMAELQRKMAEGKNVVMEGRDIGTNVFPNANVKIYLDATPEERAKRRMKQNEEKGINIPYEKILENIIFRDNNDKTSTVAPLKQAEDAIYIDSSNMTIKEVTDEIINIVKENNQ